MPSIIRTPFSAALFGSRAIGAAGICYAATCGVDWSRMRYDRAAFATESIASGLSAAVPTMLMCYNRRDRTKPFSIAKSAKPVFVAFMLFFMLNVILEISGINAGGVVSNVWVDVATCAYAAFMVALAWRSSGVKTIADFRATFDELALFSVSNAISTYIIATNRRVSKARVVRKTLLSAGVNAMMYTAMRLGGVFDTLAQ